MEIRQVKPDEKEVISEIAQMHTETFEGFFLTFMGKGFLRCMYSCFCTYKESGVLAAFDGAKPVGFLAYSGDYSGLFKFMIKRRLPVFAWYSLGAFLRKPKVFIRLVRAFLKPSDVKRPEKYVELASIGVKKSEKSKGIGSALIDSFKKQVDFTKYDYISLETDAENNDPANCFYKKNGFFLEKTYETREGRKMNEYRYRES